MANSTTDPRDAAIDEGIEGIGQQYSRLVAATLGSMRDQFRELRAETRKRAPVAVGEWIIPGQTWHCHCAGVTGVNDADTSRCDDCNTERPTAAAKETGSWSDSSESRWLCGCNSYFEHPRQSLGCDECGLSRPPFASERLNALTGVALKQLERERDEARADAERFRQSQYTLEERIRELNLTMAERVAKLTDERDRAMHELAIYRDAPWRDKDPTT